jgi:hypothetical protein
VRVATTKYQFPEGDPHAADLQLLARRKATPDVLQQCPSLLALMSPSLVPVSAPTHVQARALLSVLREVIDREFVARNADLHDVKAGCVLAAGTLIGLVTDHPDTAQQLPSKTVRTTTMNKADRQEQAGAWLVDVSAGDRRQFANHEQRCLDGLRHEVLDFLADEAASGSLREQLAASHTRISSQEHAPPHSSMAVTEQIEDTATPDDSSADSSAGRPPILGADLDESAPGRTAGGLSRLRRNILIGAISVVAIAGAATGAWALMHQGSGAGSGTNDQGTHVAGPPVGGLPATTTQSAPFVTGKIYREQEGHLGSTVYSNPSSLSAVGRVQPLQIVQVSCKVLDPSMGSVSPDGYWYRIASTPWNNQAYAIANTFLNGDPIVGTSEVPQHYTDTSVQDCPSGP